MGGGPLAAGSPPHQRLLIPSLPAFGTIHIPRLGRREFVLALAPAHLSELDDGLCDYSRQRHAHKHQREDGEEFGLREAQGEAGGAWGKLIAE